MQPVFGVAVIVVPDSVTVPRLVSLLIAVITYFENSVQTQLTV